MVRLFLLGLILFTFTPENVSTINSINGNNTFSLKNILTIKNETLSIIPLQLDFDLRSDICFTPGFVYKCPTEYKITKCNRTEERIWLEDFYYLTNGSNWLNNTNWLNDSIDYCEWYGIRCCKAYFTINSRKPHILGHPCLNIMRLSYNNLSGVLPNYWFNSSLFTVLMIGHNNLYGSVKDYSKLLPNLGIISFRYNNFKNLLPKYPIAHCLIIYYCAYNSFNGTIHNWNVLRQMLFVDFARNSLVSTLPKWNNWIHPSDVTFYSNPNIYGTIPKWNNWNIILLNQMDFTNNSLNGTVPPFSNNNYNVSCLISQFDENYTFCYNISTSPFPHRSIKLRENKLSGKFPFKSLINFRGFLHINNNKFTGTVNLPNDENYWWYYLDLSYNEFEGLFPCLNNLKHLVGIEINNNKFKGFQKCNNNKSNILPNSLKYIFLSDNKRFKGNFQDIFHRDDNKTYYQIISLSNTKINGHIPAKMLKKYYNNTSGRFLELHNTLLSGNFPKYRDVNRTFNQTYIVSGNFFNFRVSHKYTEQIEYDLTNSMIPNYEYNNYFIYPIISGAISFIAYVLFYYYFIHNSKSDKKDKKKRNNDNQLGIKNNVLLTLKIICIALFILSLISVVIMGLYYLGSNYIQFGYKSLQYTAVYLGNEYSGNLVYSYIIFGYYLIYTIVFTLIVLIIDFYNINYNIKNRDIYNYSNLSINKKCFGISITCFIILLILSIPTFVYTLFKVLPENTIFTSVFSLKTVNYVFPFVILIIKQFLITIILNKILVIKYNVNIKIRNHIIQVFRFLTVILFSLIIIFVFDNSCYQNWKYFYKPCSPEPSARVKAKVTENFVMVIYVKTIKGSYSHIFSVPYKYNINYCKKTFKPYKCYRRFLSIIGPFLLSKMILNVWTSFLPIIFNHKKYLQLKFKFYYYLNKLCCCNKLKYKKDYFINKGRTIESDFLNIISNLELIIIFGWCIPLLIPLFFVLFLGNYMICYYLDIIKHSNVRYFIPIVNYLYVSLLLQQMIGYLYWNYTLSKLTGKIALVISGINWLIVILCKFIYKNKVKNRVKNYKLQIQQRKYQILNVE